MIHLRDSRRSLANVSCRSINATLGFPGLPQSGTGQTALLTGVNAAKVIGKHFGPHPYSTLRPVIGESNLFQRARRLGGRPYYTNAFPEQYFKYIEARPGRMTAISMAWMASGGELNNDRALFTRRALSADITNERWPSLGYPRIPEVSPQKAGAILSDLSLEYNIVLFEYYLTDHAGHSRSMEEATDVLGKVDGLLEGILEHFDPEKQTLIITSDHGNMEDLSTKTHTRNPVPFIVVGKHHWKVAHAVDSIVDVTPAIMSLFS